MIRSAALAAALASTLVLAACSSAPGRAERPKTVVSGTDFLLDSPGQIRWQCAMVSQARAQYGLASPQEVDALGDLLAGLQPSEPRGKVTNAAVAVLGHPSDSRYLTALVNACRAVKG
jgi:hypothetical protein